MKKGAKRHYVEPQQRIQFCSSRLRERFAQRSAGCVNHDSDLRLGTMRFDGCQNSSAGAFRCDVKLDDEHDDAGATGELFNFPGHVVQLRASTRNQNKVKAPPRQSKRARTADSRRRTSD
jgi:hypothetical protein